MSRYDPWQSGGIGWICERTPSPHQVGASKFQVCRLESGRPVFQNATRSGHLKFWKPHGETAETQVEIQIVDEGGMLLDGGHHAFQKITS